MSEVLDWLLVFTGAGPVFRWALADPVGAALCVPFWMASGVVFTTMAATFAMDVIDWLDSR